MVLSPKKLWEAYNRKLMPLETSVIGSQTTPFGTEKHVYFNGEATSVGCTRIYARLLLPQEPTDKAVMVLLEPHRDIQETDFSHFLQKGWAVLAVDYAGSVFDRTRFTIYPPTLAFANYDPKNLYAVPETPQKNCWYIWTTVCLRSLTYLQSEGFERVAVVGVGIGGSHVLKTAAISSFPVCAVSLFSPGFFPLSADNELALAGIDVNGYAAMLKIPFLQICCSNDADSSLDFISEMTDQTIAKSALCLDTDETEERSTDDVYLYIAPRVARSYSHESQQNIDIFLSSFLQKEKNPPVQENNFPVLSEPANSDSTEQKNKKERFVPAVTLSAYGSANKLYYSVKCAQPVKEAVLYISHGVTDPAYRNWRTLSIEKAGEQEYIGYTEVYAVDKPVYAFVSVTAENGFVYCSPVVKKIPSALNVLPTMIVKRRLIYDSEMGIDDFFAMEDKYTPVIKDGPFGIGGICGSRGLCTYKIGDVTYSGNPDSVLQLLLFSPVPQEVTFSVTDEYQFNTYTCTKFVSPESDWTKIMLSVSDFKSPDSTFAGWHTAIFLRIDAAEEYIISSLLWV